jgi:hypothetical protein
MVAFGVVLPVILWFATQSVSDRLGGNRLGNSSWEERASSIVAASGIFAGGDLKTLLLGFGPGLTSYAVTESRGLEALWSILLSYAFDTGFVGMVALCWLALLLLKNWLRVRLEPVFALTLMVWVVGITLTTSYEQLLPLWLALGWLTIWPEVFIPAVAVAERAAVARRIAASVPDRVRTEPSPWLALIPVAASRAKKRRQ